MSNNAVFTICANNYLAQAITLKESTLAFNANVDFYLVLADRPCDLPEGIEMVLLSEEWCPDWKSMAFKYNVIEFSTSLKPFFFSKLLKDGYQKIIYLDPDIYVLNSLEVVFEALNQKSIVLTPHYCIIQEKYDGAVPENTFMNDGVFNLGFCAIKNDQVGQEIVAWWKNRLHNKAFSQFAEGLFTDQKWMDFIPAFFPDSFLASHHLGLNTAIWNLHERTLKYDKGEYSILRKGDGHVFPLIFFHFSGFDPFDYEIINRRHPDYNIHTFPTFKPLIEEYREKVYKNGYKVYSNIDYSFNYFENGMLVTPLLRRIYRRFWEERPCEGSNPFSVRHPFYRKLKSKRMLNANSHTKVCPKGVANVGENGVRRFENILLFPFLRFFFRIFGERRYMLIVRLSQKMSLLEYHKFLIW